jgi:hypothetical protein
LGIQDRQNQRNMVAQGLDEENRNHIVKFFFFWHTF